MENRKSVLIITYYWPPVGGSGVQRWLKMSRYLRDKGWEPIIYTPENPSFGTVDHSLSNEVPTDMEVIKLPIWEPYQIFSRLKGKRGPVSASDVRIKKNKSWIDKLMLWIRGNLFIPDPRIFWVRPSVKFLPDIIAANKIQAVITTGPPHSLHLIGLKLQKKTGINWIADFRDPWTQWDLYEEFNMLPLVRKLHRRLERKVLQKSDRVFTINHYYKKAFEKLGGREVDVITNGYDEADFQDYSYHQTNIFSIRHIGIVDEMRDPTPFIEALQHFLNNHPDLNIEVEFTGNVAQTFKEKVAENSVLDEVVKFESYKPHAEIIKKYETTEVLLLVLTRSEHAAGNTTGKIYEYLASGARILAIGPTDGEVAEILKDTGAGRIVDPSDIERINEILESYLDEFIEGRRPDVRNVNRYSRRAQAYEVAKILDKL
ncbi:MAG: glycosyltransferase [Candidatus Cyclobacteriaceae bacterium M2_1C_046]